MITLGTRNTAFESGSQPIISKQIMAAKDTGARQVWVDQTGE